MPSTARPSHWGGRASGTWRNADGKLLAKCPGDKRNLQRGAVKPPSACNEAPSASDAKADVSLCASPVPSSLSFVRRTGEERGERGALRAVVCASSRAAMSDPYDADVDPTGPAMMLILPEDSPLFEATGFLGWVTTTAGPDGAPRKATPFAVAAPLLARCRLAAAGQFPLPPVLLDLCPLTFALTGDAWARVLAALGGARGSLTPLSPRATPS